MNNKGFTLMEILAVVVILAVVAMFALPGIRAIRAEVYHMQAKTAAVKMADAMRSYYRDTKGRRITGVVAGGPDSELLPSVTSANGMVCDSVSNGVPVSAEGAPAPMQQLFACGYLSVKDFASVPYRFDASDALFTGSPSVLVQAIGLTAAGRHRGDSWCVYRDSHVGAC